MGNTFNQEQSSSEKTLPLSIDLIKYPINTCCIEPLQAEKYVALVASGNQLFFIAANGQIKLIAEPDRLVGDIDIHSAKLDSLERKKPFYETIVKKSPINASIFTFYTGFSNSNLHYQLLEKLTLDYCLYSVYKNNKLSHLKIYDLLIDRSKSITVPPAVEAICIYSSLRYGSFYGLCLSHGLLYNITIFRYTPLELPNSFCLEDCIALFKLENIHKFYKDLYHQSSDWSQNPNRNTLITHTKSYIIGFHKKGLSVIRWNTAEQTFEIVTTLPTNLSQEIIDNSITAYDCFCCNEEKGLWIIVFFTRNYNTYNFTLDIKNNVIKYDGTTNTAEIVTYCKSGSNPGAPMLLQTKTGKVYFLKWSEQMRLINRKFKITEKYDDVLFKFQDEDKGR